LLISKLPSRHESVNRGRVALRRRAGWADLKRHVAVIIAAAVLLFTEGDNRGIHRPDWAGGAFIPWSSVTEVSTGASPEVLQVRAGEKKINLSLMLFSDPAALVALIRRHVPADRLKNI
jgi:hypothetical protein